MNIFDERIKKLQAKMHDDGLKAYIIPATDPHLSEYCADHYLAERLYFCSFRGTDGTLLVTLDNYYIYTDGRYWVEAEKELAGTDGILVYDGKPNVPSLQEYVKQNNLYPLGLDSSLFSINQLRKFYIDDNHPIKHVSYRYLVENLPPLPADKIWEVKPELLSTTRGERVSKILEYVKSHHAENLILTSLDDIAYVLGYRGSDISATPIFYSYLYIENNGLLHLFINREKLPSDFSKEVDIIVHNYDDLISFIDKRANIPTLIDPNKTNSHIISHLNKKVYATSPAYLFKAIKGDVEIKNTIKVHILDGIAVLKLMKYIDDNIKTGDLDEYKCAEFVDNARKEHPLCYDVSFETIAAVDENAAMMHYAPSKISSAKVTANNQLLLVDSGGQYYGGTTDITRTFILNDNPAKEVIHDYTLTLKAQINLSRQIFIEKSTGHTIDIASREIMWREGLDYKCGTGHGVGYMNCVHEGPIGFRYYDSPDRDDKAMLVPGHIITIEPGVYKTDKYGIRLENELLVEKAFETSDGQFYKFKTITYCPYVRKAIDVNMLTDEELEWLNGYNSLVYETLSPHITDEELKDYLKEQTAEIKR